jgi:hypothetical protein
MEGLLADDGNTRLFVCEDLDKVGCGPSSRLGSLHPGVHKEGYDDEHTRGEADANGLMFLTTNQMLFRQAGVGRR